MHRTIEDRLKELRDAPLLEPSERARRRTLAAMASASEGVERPHVRWAAVWIAVMGLGALIGLTVLHSSTERESAPAIAGTPGDRVTPTEPDEIYAALAQTSSSLERLLAELPAQRQVMRLSTAGTLVGLEDQIALIDDELARADVSSVPEYRTALMQDRVAVMSALVQLRYAQSVAFTY